MTKQEREQLQKVIDRLESVMTEVDAVADTVEAMIMKKTTQRSPEFHGGANC